MNQSESINTKILNFAICYGEIVSSKPDFIDKRIIIPLRSELLRFQFDERRFQPEKVAKQGYRWHSHSCLHFLCIFQAARGPIPLTDRQVP